jgi:site-specific DNA recombinase
MTATLPIVPTTRNTAASKVKRSRAQQDSRRAAIYARVSLDQTGEGTSVSQQEESARELIARRGWELAEVYVDNSISGTGKKHRPRFYEMLEAVKRGEVDAIVARHMDRIARNGRERLELVNACREQGVIIALVQGSDMDPTTASGRMIIDVLGSVAEMEIGIKSERHVVALERHARAGKVPHGPRLFGYTTAGNVEPTESVIVAEIFERFYGGESLRSVTRWVQDRGVPTRSVVVNKLKLDKINADPKASVEQRSKAQRAYDKSLQEPWSTRTVRDMLTNPRYAGWAVYRGEVPTDNDGNPLRGQWSPLVSEEVFDVIQARLSDPARKTNRVGTDRRYIGSSLYVCNTCESPVETINGGKYYCAGHLIREHSHVDMFVKDVIAERLADPNLSNLLAPVGDDMKPVVEESKQLRARLAKIDNEYDEGIIDGRRWKSAKEKVAAKLREADKKLATRKGGAALGKIAESRDPAQAFRDASLMGQRAVIDALAVVRLRRAPRGRLKRDAVSRREVIDPATVDIDWRR